MTPPSVEARAFGQAWNEAAVRRPFLYQLGFMLLPTTRAHQRDGNEFAITTRRRFRSRSLVQRCDLLAEFADLDQHELAKAAAADAGLTPSHYESGTSVRRPKMSKMGKTGVRAALYWPAITAMTRCPAMKAFAERLAARGKAKKVIIGAVMRKLVHICYGVLKHQTPYNPAKALGRTTLAT